MNQKTTNCKIKLLLSIHITELPVEFLMSEDQFHAQILMIAHWNFKKKVIWLKMYVSRNERSLKTDTDLVIIAYAYFQLTQN